MSCYSPITIRQKESFITVPCGRCMGCLQDKRAEWTFRLHQELKNSSSAQFITLTYDDENLLYNENGNGCLYKPDLQNFLKRLRKRDKTNNIRYYAVGEYGSKSFRPHYHLLLFNNSLVDNIYKSWTLGFVQIGKVEAASIHYVTKYLINRYDDMGNLPPQFATMSRRPGIGANYIDENYKFHKKQQLSKVNMNGISLKMPRYYRQKIYSKHEMSVQNSKAEKENDLRNIRDQEIAEEKNRNIFKEKIEAQIAKTHLANKYQKCKF